MINRARLIQCLPWRCLEQSRIEPDREAIANALARWLDNALIGSDGAVKRGKPSELVESLKDAKAALKTLRRHLKAAKLDDHTLPIFDADGDVCWATYGSLARRMDQALDTKIPMPHPAQNSSQGQWRTYVMRGTFYNLQDVGLVDWTGIQNKDQAVFLSAVLIEAGQDRNLPARPWTAEKWRKSRDDYFNLTAVGYQPPEFA